MLFYAFKMAVAIAFLWDTAVEAILAQNHKNTRNLNCFYSIFPKKHNSHSHFKHVKKHRIKHRNCFSGAITLCSPKNFYQLFHVHIPMCYFINQFFGWAFFTSSYSQTALTVLLVQTSPSFRFCITKRANLYRTLSDELCQSACLPRLPLPWWNISCQLQRKSFLEQQLSHFYYSLGPMGQQDGTFH